MSKSLIVMSSLLIALSAISIDSRASHHHRHEYGVDGVYVGGVGVYDGRNCTCYNRFGNPFACYCAVYDEGPYYNGGPYVDGVWVGGGGWSGGHGHGHHHHH